MADSVGPAQSPASCQFCEESEEEIKWMCFHCELYLCEICNRRIHSKMKKNQDHKVVALRDLNSQEAIDTRRKVDLENLTCEVHEDQKCVSFCLNCHVALCLICSYEEHQNHDKKELLKLYDEKIAEIQTAKKDIGKGLSIVDIEETMLTKMSDNKSEEYQKVKDGIGKREADIITEVKKYSQELYDDVDQVYQPIVTEIQKNLTEVNRMKVRLKEKRDIVDNILHSHQACDVLDSSKTIGDIPVPQQYGDNPTTRCLFTPGDSLDSKVRQIFGEVNKIPELKLVNTYQTELEGVINIINWNTNEKVISSSSSGKLQRVGVDNDTMTVIMEKDINVNDMALMDNGDLVISSDGRELKIYTKEGTVISYKSFDPFYTLGVHVNRHKEVLVGLSDQLSMSIRPDSITKVVLLDQAGDIHHTYQYTMDRQRLFTRPRRIITCQDIVCVVDLLNDSCEGRRVALDYGGNVQWIYNGEGNEGQNKFYPFDIAVTTVVQIIIADDTNHAIHVVNPRGQVIVCHQAEDMGVSFLSVLTMRNCCGWDVREGKITRQKFIQ